MLRVILFANGVISNPEIDARQIRPEDIIIAADGGARHCLRVGIIPQQIIGDFDSLSEDELRSLEQAGAALQRFPAQKDETDLELALQKALEYLPDEIIILGGLGARWDMSLANLLLAAHPDFVNQRITFLDGAQSLRLLPAGQTIQLQGSIGDTISLIPIGGDVCGVITQGLEYPLNNETIYFGTPRGVSNVMLAPEISIHISAGLLLVLHIAAQSHDG